MFGTSDYLLLVDRAAIGAVEAKKVGTLLSGVAEQSDHYAANLPEFFQTLTAGSLPFRFKSMEVETYLHDHCDPTPRWQPCPRSILRWPRTSGPANSKATAT
jgi:type I restriction enzyme R subunit